MSKKRAFTLTLLPLLSGSLFACQNQEQATQINLRFGTLIGNRAEDKIDNTSQLTFIKKSALNRLVLDEENFLLLVHGSSDTCSCYTTWHNEILAPYVKRHRLLVRAITLKELESDEEYYGLKRVSGYDTLAVFSQGKVAYQKTTDVETDPFVTTYAGFSEWMGKRIADPKIFYVDEEILNGYYEGNQAFTVYFGRDTCSDCGYLNHHALQDYLDRHERLDENFLYIDFDAYRPTRDDPDYEAKMALYQEKKDFYGLSWNEDNPAGFGSGVFPTIYYVNPDGVSYDGDVIEAAGVFYNETIGEDKVLHDTYFTQERYEEAKDTYLTYLSDADLAPKWIDPNVFKGVEDTSRAQWHDLLTPYLTPFFTALLDYAVGA